MDESKQLYSVTIEWNGQKPSTTWYRRLAKLALSRGNSITKDSPLAQRQQHNHTGKGVMLQEGCFLVDSESLANTIALYAMGGLEVTDRKTQQHKVIFPAHVLIGKVETVNPVNITPEDREAINRINATYGRRGKPLPATDWIVSCYECMVTHHAHDTAVAVCPVCHGTRIEVMQGIPTQFDLSNASLLTASLTWAATRFEHNKFQLPARFGKCVPIPNGANIYSRLNAKDVAILDAIDQPRTPLLQADLDSTLELYDAIYIARAKHDPKKRAAARVDAIAKYIQFGGDALAVAQLFAEDAAHADLLDAALTLGSTHVATLLLHQTLGVKP